MNVVEIIHAKHKWRIPNVDTFRCGGVVPPPVFVRPLNGPRFLQRTAPPTCEGAFHIQEDCYHGQSFLAYLKHHSQENGLDEGRDFYLGTMTFQGKEDFFHFPDTSVRVRAQDCGRTLVRFNASTRQRLPYPRD